MDCIWKKPKGTKLKYINRLVSNRPIIKVFFSSFLLNSFRVQSGKKTVTDNWCVTFDLEEFVPFIFKNRPHFPVFYVSAFWKLFLGLHRSCWSRVPCSRSYIWFKCSLPPFTFREVCTIDNRWHWSSKIWNMVVLFGTKAPHGCNFWN